MKNLNFCPHCGKAGTSAIFDSFHFENCVYHSDPEARKQAVLRRDETFIQCYRCGFLSTPVIIKGFHNARCRAVPLVGQNVTTGELRFYRWNWQAAEDGFSADAIRQILRGARNTTAGYFFREASQEEVDAGKVLPDTSHTLRRRRGRAVARIDENGDETLFPTLAAAAKITPGASPSKISEVIAGDRKTHAGYRWRYLENN
ncbi:hypothetical protein NMD10_27770 (plasmid) [Citrobacter portucalensis]|uniref:hypothetical protein n=1 Tax=Citrobacter portucalensis TaxID=1639133 RepID=UPI00351CC0C1